MKANKRVQGTRHKVSGPLNRDVRLLIELTITIWKLHDMNEYKY